MVTTTPTSKLFLKNLLFSGLFLLFSALSFGQTTLNFYENGVVQNWTVPAGVTSMTVQAIGAAGGLSGQPDATYGGGAGATIVGKCTVTAGHKISIVVGQLGFSSNGDNTGGGGGATYVYDSTTLTMLVVAGGGGGEGYSNSSNGANGGNGGITYASPYTPTNSPGGSGTIVSGGHGGNRGKNTMGTGPGAGGAGWISNGDSVGGGSSGDPSGGPFPCGGGQDRANYYAGGAPLGFGPDVNAGGYGGGGGGGYSGGGGGGGYNGGGGGDDLGNNGGAGGGGGGSYLLGTIVGTPVATNDTNGSVQITYTIGSSLSTTTSIVANVSCHGGNNGNASASPSGGTTPYTYSWSNGSSTVSTSNPTGAILTAGTYTVTVHDALNNSATATVTITQPTAVTITINSHTNELCNGNNTGSVTANAASGGTSPYSYSWSPSGGTNLTANGLTAGTYTITATDSHGCSGSNTSTITQPGALTATGNVTANELCSGNNSGSGNVVAGGGTSPYTYAWSNGASTSSIGTLTAATYTVTVHDHNNCSATAGFTVTQPSSLTATGNVTANELCGGGNTGSGSVTAGGGTSPYTYSWSNGATTSSIGTLTAATYTVTVHDNHNCSATAGFTVTQPSSLTATGNVTANELCIGGNNGSGNVTAGGGSTPYTYSWSNGATTSSISALTANTYTVTVHDNNNCSATAGITITAPTAVTVTLSSSTNAICSTNGSATVSGSGGTGTITYIWNDANTTHGATLSAPAGNYTVTATDNNSCTGTLAVTIGTSASTLTATGNVTANELCNGNNTGSGNVSAGGGTAPYTYSWSNGATTSSISALTAATYTVTVYDNNNCSATAGITITAPTAVTVTLSSSTNAICSTNGSATVSGSGGTGTISYIWNDANTTHGATLSAPAGNFTVTATDNNNCTGTLAVTIGTSASTLTATGNVTANELCNGNNTGSGNVSAGGGTAPYTYSWSNGATTSSISALTAAAYTVTVYDNNNCSATAGITITAPTAVTVTLSSSTNAICSTNGSATVSGSGGTGTIAYIWNDANTTHSATLSAPAGNYTVTATDNNSCTGTLAVTIGTSASTLTATGNVTANELCNGNNTGSGNVSAGGGTAPYTYSWSNGATTSSISALTAATYTVTVHDNNNCSATGSITITQPSLLLTNATASNNITCYGGSNGSVSSIPTGGTSPYTYYWSDANTSTTATVSNLSAGTYSVIVQDSKGCAGIASATITQPVRFIYITAGTVSNVTCSGANNGSATVTSVGGNAPYTYAWNNGTSTVSAAQSPNTLSGGIYTVTVMDNCGVTYTASVTITEPNALRDSIATQTNITCGGGNGGSATIGTKGGSYPYSYSWSNGATLATESGLTAGTYSVLVTDKNGCTNAVTGITITQPNPLIESLASITYPACYGESTGAASVNVSGGSSPYAYVWAPNVSSTNSASGLLGGTYTVSVKDAHRCTTSLVVAITQPMAIRDSAVKSLTVNISCSGGNNGSITMGTKYGTSPYHYLWSPNTSCTTATASGLSAGTYTIGVQDANGCSSSFTTVTITQPATLLRDSISLLTNVGCFGGNGGTASVGTRGGSNPYTYAWSDGKTTYNVSGLTAGGYTVTITDKAGCSNTLSATITQPATAVTATVTTNCIGNKQGTLSVNASGGTPGYVYLWSTGKTTTSITVSNGTFTVKVSDAHNCSATYSATTACPDALPSEKGHDGVADNNTTNCCGGLDNINLYPNPNNGQFTIQWTEVSGQWSVEVYSVLGQKVYSQSAIHEPQSIINLSNQPNGVYLVRILDNNGNLVSMKKVMKTN